MAPSGLYARLCHAFLVCCILMQMLCVVSQKSLSFRAPPLDPAGGHPSPRPAVCFYVPSPNNPMRSMPWTFGRYINKQEAFEKCWAHSPLRAAACPNFTLPFTRCRYCRTPPLSHAACASMSTTTTTRDRGDRYGPIEWPNYTLFNV